MNLAQKEVLVAGSAVIGWKVCIYRYKKPGFWAMTLHRGDAKKNHQALRKRMTGEKNFQKKENPACFLEFFAGSKSHLKMEAPVDSSA